MLARQQVAKEVNQAALMLGAAEKNVEASKKGLDQAEEQFRIGQERFAGGRGIQLEVLDAQATLTRARFNLVASLADHESAKATWLKATGRTRYQQSNGQIVEWSNSRDQRPGPIDESTN